MDEGLDEKHELWHLFKEMWERGDSSLRRIYPSWEDLENNIEIKFETNPVQKITRKKHCPYCNAILEIKKPMDSLFPYDQCKSCKNSFYVSGNLDIRKLTDEETENMPAEWVRVLQALGKKKMAIVLKLE